jgi:hypothetical protein
LVSRDVLIEGQRVKIHCHCLQVDANGRVKMQRLAEFMRYAIADYAIPRTHLEEAKIRDARFKSTSAVSMLHERARATFTDLENTGEGGEMLLFLLAERFLKLPQVLCKMDLKTDARMHYHGADGVYASVTNEGILKLHWGESKVYANPTDAIRECLKSLTPFLVEPDHTGASRERDLVLLSDKADLSDPKLTSAFKRYFDRTSPLSNRVEYCGVALVAFDADFYPPDDKKGIADDVIKSADEGLKNWAKNIGSRLSSEKLDQLEIDFFCIPMPSVESFRSAFLTSLGLKK